MFERFTHSARRVVVLAQEEARLHNSETITSAHLVLGLLRDVPEGGWSELELALDAMGVAVDPVRDAMVKLVDAEAGAGFPSGHIPFTPEAKKSLEATLRQALQLGHRDIDALMIFLGVLAGDNPAASELERLGAGLGRAQGIVARKLIGQVDERNGGPIGEAELLAAIGELEDRILPPEEVRREERPVSFRVEIDVTDRKVVLHGGDNPIYADLDAAKALQRDLDRAIKMCEGDGGLLFERFTVTWSPERVAAALAELTRYWEAVTNPEGGAWPNPSADAVSIGISAIKQVLSS